MPNVVFCLPGLEFRTSNRKYIKPSKLEINDDTIKQVSSTTFLGVTLYNKLNWAEHMLIGICSSNLKKVVEPEDTKQH